MYSILFIFLLSSSIMILLYNSLLEEKINELFNENKNLYFLIFIILLSFSFLLSLCISLYEFLIKKMCLGIFFTIILNLSIDYCVVYISYLSYFKQVFCFLTVLESGAFGCLFICLIVRNNNPNIILLSIANLFFSLSGLLSLFFI